MANRIKGITVEIGGDTTKLQTALKGVNSEIRNTQSQLKDVERLLKLDPGNTELLAQRHKLLGDAVSETREKLETLKTAAEQANTALANGDISQAQYDALQREIIETEHNLEGLEAQANQSATAVQSIAASGEKLQSVGSNIENAGKKLSVVSAAVTAGGVASAKMAMDFEDAMAKVNTIANTAEVPLEDLQKSILELSNQTGISSSEIAQNVYDAISAGQQTGDAVNFVSNSTKLATAGFADAGNALDVLTTIMNAYGLEADKVTDVSDMLIQTQNLGKTTVGDLSASMGKIIPTANAYRVKLDQLCTGYAIMTANGVATAESTTYMNSMLNELGKSGTSVSKILQEKTGQSFSELMESGSSLSDVLAIINDAAVQQGLSFGDMWSSSEAAKAGLILLGDSADSFNQTLDEMRQSTGATDTAFEKLQTNSYTIQKAINQLKNAAIELGTAIMTVLAPMLESLAEKISMLTEWFSNLSDGQKKTIVVFGMIVAALGPVLIIIGKIVSAVGTVMTILPTLISGISMLKNGFIALGVILAANPIILIVAAVAAAIAALVLLYNKCEWFRNAVNAVWQAISDFFMQIWNGIVTFLTQTIPNAVNSVIAFFQSLPALWKQFWETLKTTVLTIAENLKNAAVTAFQNLVSGIANTLGGLGSVVSNGFQSAISFITALPSKALQWGADFVHGIANGIRNAIGSVTSAVSDVASKIRSFLHFSVPDEGPLTDYEAWMPDFMNGLAKGIRKSRSAVTKAMDMVASDLRLDLPQNNLKYTVGGSLNGVHSTDAANIRLTQPLTINGTTLANVVSEIQYAQGKAVLRNLGM